MVHLEIHSGSVSRGKSSVNFECFEELLLRTQYLFPERFPEKDTSLSLIFVNNKKIQELNKKYRKKNVATDVLSFLLYDATSPEQIRPLGDLYISLQKAKIQAEHKKYSLQGELNTLFTHGLLHLLGFDHKNTQDFFKMNAAEKQVLKSGKTLLGCA
ncbi:rRNA maturation RNase YbeY [Candidatus Peregrinibacteria bacterium]|nr:rRNA maturation RNase YbeY [Candidatus Peregrinibacteria bacterium]